MVVTAANVADVTQAHALLHGKEQDVFADAGCQGVDKRKEVQDRHPKVNWHVAALQGLEEDRGADHDALDAGQSVACAQAPCAALRRVSAPQWGARAPCGAAKGPGRGSKRPRKLAETMTEPII